MNAFLIPQQAVQELQGKRSVVVVDADGKAQYREITANTRDGNNWVVESGLTEGDTVIVEGIQKARPGAPVKAITAGANAGDAKKAGDEKSGAATKGDGKDAATTAKGKDAKAPSPDKGAK